MLKRGRTITALLGSATIALMSLAFAQPSNADTTLGPWVIQNVGSQQAGNVLCVQPDPSNPGPDIQLVQQSCFDPVTGNLLADAQWSFVPLSGSGASTIYHVVNVGTGNCMRALSNSDFSPVDTIDCTGISNEKWSLQVAPSGGHLELISHVAGGSRCLDVFEGGTTPGVTIDIFHCSSNSVNTNEAQSYFVQPSPVAAGVLT